MGFNFRFTTKPAGAKSDVPKPSAAKPFVNSVDKRQAKEHIPLSASDQASQSEAPYGDDSLVSSPKIPRLGKEEISVVAAGGSLLLLFSTLPETLPLGVIGRSTILLGTLL